MELSTAARIDFGYLRRFGLRPLWHIVQQIVSCLADNLTYLTYFYRLCQAECFRDVLSQKDNFHKCWR